MSFAVPLLLCALPASVFPQSNSWTAEQDHRHMMEQLGIKSLRPGRDGRNTNAPNFANYDEAKANPFPTLPDPLKLADGGNVDSAEIWWKRRRPELVELFDREIYGRVPAKTPAVKWEVLSTTNETNGGIPVIVKKLSGHVDNSADTNITVDIDLTLGVPANAPGPVPVMMQFSFNFGAFNRNRNGASTNRPGGFRPPDEANSWRHQALAKGWGYAVMIPTTVQPDNGAGLAQGIIGLCNQGRPRKPDDWGALRAWAWGASRAIDYFETDPAVDAKQIGLEGHSRYGKATLVAMAYEPRLAVGYVSSSGEGGAKLHRRDWGEVVENIAASGEYHWMAGNFLKYAGPLNWNDLPVDSHELIALCAPRPVFYSAGVKDQGDGWVDAKGTFLAAAAAGPVYRLLGCRDLGTTNFPPVETALTNGPLAFRQHSGGHTDVPNWPVFFDWARSYIKFPAATDGKN